MSRILDMRSQAAPWPASGPVLEVLREVAWDLWCDRAEERGWTPPKDLSGSCKFSSLLLHEICGLEMRGNRDHQFCVTADGTVVDLNAGSGDILALARPYRRDQRFWGNREHREALESCLPRVAAWAQEARQRLREACPEDDPECLPSP